MAAILFFQMRLNFANLVKIFGEILRFMQKCDERTDGWTEGVLLSPDNGLRPQAGDNKCVKNYIISSFTISYFELWLMYIDG